MGHTRQHAQEFAEMAISLHDGDGFRDTVDRVLQYAVQALGCGYAGVITVHDRTRVETVAATDPLVAALDAVQMKFGQGPDLELLRDRPLVRIGDVRAETRWPEWAEQVAGAGIRSMLGVRLDAGETVVGSLNFYDVEADKFDDEDVDVALLLARHAAVALDSVRETDNLWRAIDARNLIGQAQGILMERFGLDADQAFAVLRRYSQDHNLKLRDVAVRLIETRALPD